MIRKNRILLVEDEKAILEGLEDLFVFHGYEVESRMDGGEGLKAALSSDYDCILLDVMLPTLDGFSICNEIRKQSRDTPIVMLTAKNAEEDVINGLSLGADDYISKPFSVRELVLRINALVRRTGGGNGQEVRAIAKYLTINLATLSGVLNGSEVLFTRRELDILVFLKNEQPKPVSRKDLLSEVWGYRKGVDVDTRTVDIHIAKLRKKIELDPKNPTLIMTVRCEGYLLNPAEA